ncbi:MAG: glycosyltransferase family 4 protein [Methanobacterium sp. ERen5]|nr:MAG: glycosyltransferase family 4 protein [Methanobacterium sp. ERen5]
MKIAVFHNLSSGGAKRALYNNLIYLSKNHTIDVYVPSTANENFLSLKHIVNNLKVYPVTNSLTGFILSSLKYFPSKSSLTDLKKVQEKMAEDVNSKDYDVVYCEQDRHTMSPFFLKYLKKPHVYYCQQPIIYRNNISKKLYENAGLNNKNLKENLRFKIYGKRMSNLDKQLSNYSKYTVVNSYFSREILLKSYGFNTYVSYLGVNTDVFKQSKIPKENFVLSVGQCLPEKGYEFIIRSLAKIDPSLRPEFVIVSDQGNDSWKNYLIELSSKLNVKLVLLSLIDDKKLVTLYNQAKLVVYAPCLEPFGLVPLESMSCGTPVVGVKEGGVRETVIHGKTGILTERDEFLFSEAIVELLINKDKVNFMSENAVNYIKNFWDIDNSGQRLFHHLKRAVNSYNQNI